MWSFKRFTALCSMAALLAAPAYAEEKKPKVKKPKLEVSASPRMAQAPMPGYARMIRLSIVISNANEEYWCPEIRVEWDDGDVTTRESDCVPFEQAPADELERKSYPDTGALYHPYTAPGEYRIRVQLLRNGKVFSSKTAEFMLAGGD